MRMFLGACFTHLKKTLKGIVPEKDANFTWQIAEANKKRMMHQNKSVCRVRSVIICTSCLRRHYKYRGVVKKAAN